LIRFETPILGGTQAEEGAALWVEEAISMVPLNLQHPITNEQYSLRKSIFVNRHWILCWQVLRNNNMQDASRQKI
jgi:hypothetical protein